MTLDAGPRHPWVVTQPWFAYNHISQRLTQIDEHSEKITMGWIFPP
jgi:hypothetical protein